MATMIDFDEATATLAAATPEGWYLSGLTMNQDWAPRLGWPPLTYSITAKSGRAVGKRPRHYVGGEGSIDGRRMIEVDLQAVSIEALAEAVRALASLEPLYALPLDTTVRLSTYDD